MTRSLLCGAFALLCLMAITQVAVGQASPSDQSSQPKPMALADVVKATVEPTTWDDVGGEGSLEIVPAWGVAIISQTREVHEQIEALLHTVRTVRHKQDGLDIPEVRSESTEVFAAGGSSKRIEDALRSKQSIHIDRQAVSTAMARMSADFEIPIMIDRTALADIGLTGEEQVELAVPAITLRSALNLLLHEVGLTYVLDNEVLIITTPDEAETRLTVRVYPVRDLLD